MTSPRKNRSHWYVEGLMFSIILITLALALFVTGSRSPESGASDSSTVGQAAYPEPRTVMQPIATQPTLTPLGGAISSTTDKQAVKLTPYPAPGQTIPTPRQEVPIAVETPTSDTTNSIQSTIHVSRYPDIPSASRLSSVVVIGTVKQVLPARWTTPDGQRPANPQTARQVIFRPVIVEVEEYLKGETNQKIIRLYAWGGRIGNDVFELQPDDLYDFQEGERAVLFLKQPDQEASPFTLNGSNLWSIEDHYTLTSDGQAKNFYLTLPLDELRTTVQTALQP